MTDHARQSAEMLEKTQVYVKWARARPIGDPRRGEDMGEARRYYTQHKNAEFFLKMGAR